MSDTVTTKIKQAIELLNEALAACGATQKTDVLNFPSAKTPKVGFAPDFSINARAFFKRYASGSSGPQKAVLAIAYVSKGEPGVAVTKADLHSVWGTSEGLLGKRQTMYFTRAKENGWVDSRKEGEFSLETGWREAFK